MGPGRLDGARRRRIPAPASPRPASGRVRVPAARSRPESRRPAPVRRRSRRSPPGSAKLRAVTSLELLAPVLRAGRRPRPAPPRPRSDPRGPARSTASRSQAQRRCPLSTKIPARSRPAHGQDQARDPAAGPEIGEVRRVPARAHASAAAAKPSACARWGSTGPGPRNPAVRAVAPSTCAQALVCRDVLIGPAGLGTEPVAAHAGKMTTRRRGSSPSDVVSTPVDVGDHVVHDLAVGGAHRLERPLFAGLLDLGRDLAGRTRPAPGAGAPGTRRRRRGSRRCARRRGAGPPPARPPRVPGSWPHAGPTSAPRPSPSMCTVTSSSSISVRTEAVKPIVRTSSSVNVAAWSA